MAARSGHIAGLNELIERSGYQVGRVMPIIVVRVHTASSIATAVIAFLVVFIARSM